jgi:hypothetical protein
MYPHYDHLLQEQSLFASFSWQPEGGKNSAAPVMGGIENFIPSAEGGGPAS